MTSVPNPRSNLAPRMDFAAFEKALPAAVASLRTLGKAVEAAGLGKELTELLKVRVSQINGCAYCLKLHLDWARQANVNSVKLDLVAVWREASCFDARERAALSWAESLTRIAEWHVDDRLFEQTSAHFPPTELAALTTAIATINAWNRIAGALRFTPAGVPSAENGS